MSLTFNLFLVLAINSSITLVLAINVMCGFFVVFSFFFFLVHVYIRPDITVMVDWALKINFISIYPFVFVLIPGSV